MSEPMKTLRSGLHDWLRTHGGAVQEFDYEAIHDMADNFLLPMLSKAWGDGYEAGFSDADFDHLGVSTDPAASDHPVENPYVGPVGSTAQRSTPKVGLTGEDRFALGSAAMRSLGSLSGDTPDELAYRLLAVALMGAVENIAARHVMDEVEKIAAQCQVWAVERFDRVGPHDARGAALWDVACHLREKWTAEPAAHLTADAEGRSGAQEEGK